MPTRRISLADLEVDRLVRSETLSEFCSDNLDFGHQYRLFTNSKECGSR